MADDWYTDEFGRRRRIPDGDGRRSRGGGIVLAAGVAAVIGAGGVTAFGGGAAVEGGAGIAAEALPGNLAGDVVDSLPGRSASVRKTEGRKSARRGKSAETFSRFKLKELKRTVKRDLKCLLNSTGKVREFFTRTPCTSLVMRLYAVGDGHGNAAVLSVAWVGFRTKEDAAAFERVEQVQGNGDVTPLGGAPLELAGFRFTGLHYHPRPLGRTIVIGEADTATGRFDAEDLNTLAEVVTYFPKP
ncbi:hypothetical protein ACFXPA_42620 [Amycolatopsis sp. NPDC059090]|uniref:hypothetical protein n=1 Tax=unclassified Amycolatopsis TaxID=2618356 RepID=UPI00366B6326